ncbi:hypothetical protein HCN51_55645 [Nonomuraea sp. FMUSA5-5]|uniref:Uncharacterized protein n=1 Tax=Nonomuraea composti TaxID=2720023 RepID=A0ABX1BLD8_9ACTN|nr:hypothetical protein [Nonomuraea sp. FMUSA5-5]NJP98559.1 hypothetical protein [Nonomuraea sp. FMUSA5-5]
MAAFRGEERPAWLPAPATECPVGQTERTWIETSMEWFVEQFGREAALQPVALPTPEFFRFLRHYFDITGRVNALVTKMSLLMGVAVGELRVELYDTERNGGSRTVGYYEEVDGVHVIGIDRKTDGNLVSLTGTVAHELCHVRLLGEGRITTDRGDHERLTDLLTVYLGFGVFSANAALMFARAGRRWQIMPRGYLTDELLNGASSDGTRHRLGYLSKQEYGYALACYSQLRGETDPPWAAHLDPGVRDFFTRSLPHLPADW